MEAKVYFAKIAVPDFTALLDSYSRPSLLGWAVRKGEPKSGEMEGA
jgi:hypothetical protein